MDWCQEDRMPRESDIRSLNDIEALYGGDCPPREEKRMKVRRAALMLGLSEDATQEEVLAKAGELAARRALYTEAEQKYFPRKEFTH